MKVIIDRFEGEFAVVETESGEFVNLPSILVPDAKEGYTVTITAEPDCERHARIQNLAAELFK